MQNIAVTLGKLVVAAMAKEAGSCTAGGKTMPMQGTVRKYSKPDKKLMPQPAYSKQAGQPFSTMLAASAMENMRLSNDATGTSAPKKKAPIAKKMPARGPIRGTMAMRGKQRKRN
jgi:hypothetical protein